MSLQTIPKPFTNRRLKALLRSLGACPESHELVGKRDLETAWNQYPRGDHLLWFAVKLGVDRRLIVRAAARCAETALQCVPAGEDRPRLCIEAVLAWADDPTDENLARVRVARRAVADAVAYADADADVAAYAAAAAADVAADAADAAAYAADAAAYAADADDARTAARLRHAAIVRETIPFAAIAAAVSERAP